MTFLAKLPLSYNSTMGEGGLRKCIRFYCVQTFLTTIVGCQHTVDMFKKFILKKHLQVLQL